MNRGFLASLRSVDARGLARALAVVFLLNTWLSGYVAAAAAMHGGPLQVTRCLPGGAIENGGDATGSAAHELCCTLACSAGGVLPPEASGLALPTAAGLVLQFPPAGTEPHAGAPSDHPARGPPAV